jgi:hypothetical protein
MTAIMERVCPTRYLVEDGEAMTMSDSDKLRDRATRLFAMALKARETRFVSATELENLASQALAQAEDMERRATAMPIPAHGSASAGRPITIAAA